MPTRSISGVRMHFWQVVTRWRGGSSCARNHFFMGAMPLLISSRLGSFFGTSGKLSRRRWPLLSKKLRYFSRSSFKPVHCIGFLSSIVLGVCTSVFMMLWQRGGQAQKQKQPHPKRDEAV